MVLIDATPLQSEHRLRGVGAYLRSLIDAIEQGRLMEPTYLISRRGQHHVAGYLPPSRTVVVERPHRPAQLYWLYNEVTLRRALAHLRPAVFFAPDFNGVPANPHGRVVAVLHDLTALKLKTRSLHPSHLLSDLRWAAYGRKLQAADAIIAVSQNAKRDAVALLGIPAERIRVIHHGLDHDHFRPSRGAGAFADGARYFLHLGGFNDNKNQARLLQAFALVAQWDPTVELRFSGPWRERDVAWLESTAERLGLASRAKYLGYVALDELPSLYGNCLAFVFPSLEEGFGLPVLEAMACGAAVITSDRSALPEVAGEAALLVDPYSVDSIASALRLILEDPAAAARLRRAGGLRAGLFTWRETARQTVAALEYAT